MHTDEIWRPAGSGLGVRVAVVDTGVHARHPHVGGVAGGVGIEEHGRETAEYVDRLGHGTAVTAAIREKAADASLYAVRIFTTSLVTDVTRLVAAIDWAIAQRMHVVNLSLGTTEPRHVSQLTAVVDRAAVAGVLLVAACDEGDRRWWPGCLPGVIAVRADEGCPRDAFRIEPGPNDWVFRTSPYPRPIPGVPLERNLSGISFAVANMTGFIAALSPAALEEVSKRPVEALIAAFRGSTPPLQRASPRPAAVPMLRA